MRPIDPLTNRTEAPSPLSPELERVEEILRSAASFEPETQASYNFAAAAMSRRKVRSRALWMTAAGCACTALVVWCTVPRVIGPANIWTPPVFIEDVEPSVTPANDEGATGTSVNAHYRVQPAMDPLQSPLRTVSDNGPEATDEQNPPAAQWETEEVDRYTSALLKRSFVEEKAADGTVIRKPAVTVIPLESRERPSVAGGSDVGVVSLANYDASQGEATK